ncbi:MAG: hypothetical protein U0359_33990 [Byssovorax sp.]
MRLGHLGWSASLLALSCILAACKVEAPASQGQGEEKAAASGLATATAPGTASAPPAQPPITPVVTATQVTPPAVTAPAVTPPSSATGPAARPSASAAKKPPVPCPAIACARPPGCLEMGHDENGCPNCTCARGIPSLQGPPKPGQLPQGMPH